MKYKLKKGLCIFLMIIIIILIASFIYTKKCDEIENYEIDKKIEKFKNDTDNTSISSLTKKAASIF